MPKVTTKTIFIILFLSVISLAIGLGVGYNFKNISAANNQQIQIDPNKPPQKKPIFKSQIATIEGSITEVKNNMATITNDQGQSDTFLLSTKLVIYKPEKAGSPRAISSADIKQINLNQKALIVLEMIDGNYQIVSISHDNF